MSTHALRRHLRQLADALGEAPDRIGLTFARRLLAEAQSIASLHPVEARRFLHATPQRLAVCEGGDWRGVALLFDRGNGPELWRDCGRELRLMGASLRRAAEEALAPAEPDTAAAVSPPLEPIGSQRAQQIIDALARLPGGRAMKAREIGDAIGCDETDVTTCIGRYLRRRDGGPDLVANRRGSGYYLTAEGRRYAQGESM